MFQLFEKTSEKCSKITTNIYSTSFSLGIRMLSKDYRWAIYGIYGFVRLADEIVDSFDRDDKAELLEKFRLDTFEAIEKKISLNPILYSFQKVVHQYNIGEELITPFFESMKKDLNKTNYDKLQYDEYIYGSAEVVGLMCLYVFCEGDTESYEKLKPGAQSLGAAFQKVNFLRDVKADYIELSRTYFPGVDFKNFTRAEKEKIEITVSVTVNAPIEKVWERWTLPEHITKWNFASSDWHAPKAENDLRVGGKFSSRMEAKDGSFGFDFEGIYDRVEQHAHIAYHLGDARTVEVDFMTEGNTTIVREVADPETMNPLEMQVAGWQAILNNFAAYVLKQNQAQ